eukprot:NODE_10189_length_534_cov_25.119221_g9542_i0.p1 GENE.NODE_10189_length_534_cov_25.119221_g9542_i0~~NODE_10189_length_534_cov_25.119221_g9542_i0.p1  ORF type:complete len:124 (-),score=9.58 NODE_10189_length_534_cov_25.119221_g9542_i0:96-467(-)
MPGPGTPSSPGSSTPTSTTSKIKIDRFRLYFFHDCYERSYRRLIENEQKNRDIINNWRKDGPKIWHQPLPRAPDPYQTIGFKTDSNWVEWSHYVNNHLTDVRNHLQLVNQTLQSYNNHENPKY